MEGEMLVEFVPYSTEEVISTFYNSYYNRLILRMNRNLYLKDKDTPCIPFTSDDQEIARRYKLYYIIVKSEKYFPGLEDDLVDAYPEVMKYNKIIFKDVDGLSETYDKYSNKSTVNITELKTNNLSTAIDRIICRHVLEERRNIYGNYDMEIYFKVPFILNAKRIHDTGFDGCGTPKATQFYITGFKLMRKNYIAANSLMSYITDDSRYFPELHPDQYELICE